MNFKEYEKKAKCLFCERPINIKVNFIQKPRTPQGQALKKLKLFRCECSLAKRSQFHDGYTFNLPVSNKYLVQIDTRIPEFKVFLIDAFLTGGHNQILDTLVDINELPDFILLPRLKLINKLEEFLTWI